MSAGAEGRFRYDPKALRGDLVRAGLGLAMTGLPLALVPVHPAVAVVFGSATALFAVFGVRTGLRRWTVVEMDHRGIRAEGPARVEIAWEDLREIQLRYYATRRDRRGGWMQLHLKGRAALTVESTLDGFDRIAERVAAVAKARGLPLSEATVRNFGALGIAIDDQP